MYKVEFRAGNLLMSKWQEWPQIGEFESFQDAINTINKTLINSYNPQFYIQYNADHKFYMWTNGKKVQYQFRFTLCIKNQWFIGLNSLLD